MIVKFITPFYKKTNYPTYLINNEDTHEIKKNISSLFYFTNRKENLLNNLDFYLPGPWGPYFYNSASLQAGAWVEWHDNIMLYFVIIFLGVFWVLTSIIRNHIYSKSPISNKYLNYGSLTKLISFIKLTLFFSLIVLVSVRLPLTVLSHILEIRYMAPVFVGICACLVYTLKGCWYQDFEKLKFTSLAFIFWLFLEKRLDNIIGTVFLPTLAYHLT